MDQRPIHGDTERHISVVFSELIASHPVFRKLFDSGLVPDESEFEWKLADAADRERTPASCNS